MIQARPHATSYSVLLSVLTKNGTLVYKEDSKSKFDIKTDEHGVFDVMDNNAVKRFWRKTDIYHMGERYGNSTIVVSLTDDPLWGESVDLRVFSSKREKKILAKLDKDITNFLKRR